MLLIGTRFTGKLPFRKKDPPFLGIWRFIMHTDGPRPRAYPVVIIHLTSDQWIMLIPYHAQVHLAAPRVTVGKRAKDLLEWLKWYMAGNALRPGGSGPSTVNADFHTRIRAWDGAAAPPTMPQDEDAHEYTATEETEDEF